MTPRHNSTSPTATSNANSSTKEPVTAPEPSPQHTSTPKTATSTLSSGNTKSKSNHHHSIQTSRSSTLNSPFTTRSTPSQSANSTPQESKNFLDKRSRNSFHEHTASSSAHEKNSSKTPHEHETNCALSSRTTTPQHRAESGPSHASPPEHPRIMNRRPIPAHVRRALIRMQKSTCQLCGAHGQKVIIEIDHIIDRTGWHK